MGRNKIYYKCQKNSKKTKQIKATKINDKVDSFNNFFVTIAENIDKKIIHTNANYKNYPENSRINSFFLKPTNKEEVNSTIKKIKTNKTLDPNSIPKKMLKMNQHIIAKPLAYLINLSFAKEIFPKLFKAASIKPVFKKEIAKPITSIVHFL